MYKMTILAVDKLREPHWLEAAAEFEKRLRPYAKLSVIEVRSEPLTSTVTAAQSMAREGEQLLKRWPTSGTAFVLDKGGRRCSSEELARTIAEAGESGEEITFVVGGAAGLSPEVLAKTNKKISLSEMTFTHEMARVILLEQVYRSMTILAGKKYHY
jgi:23S rRNA (pseudouridine1915-N3)-methyltransferase